MCLSDYGYNQAYLSIEPDASGTFIDLVSLEGDKGYVHLVTSDGIYTCESNSCHQVAEIEDAEISFPSQSWSSYQNEVYFPLQDGNHISYSKAGIKYLELEEDGCLIESDKSELWLINDSIKFKTSGSFKWDTLKDHKIQYQDYSDAVSKGSSLYISTRDNGVFAIHSSEYDDHQVKHYTTERGLMSNYSTALNCRSDKHFIVGHNAGLTIFNGFDTKQIDLSKYTSEDVLEIESDKYGNIWCITATQLLMLNAKQEVQPIDLPLDDFEELRAIDIGEGSSLNVLTSERIFIVPKTEIEIFKIENAQQADDRAVKLYQIRNNFYYSDGKRVYGLEKNNQWAYHKKKKAPSTVLEDEYGNPYLIFKNKGKKYSKNNARLLERVRIPEGESILNICKIEGRKYYCTDSNLYEYRHGQLILLSHKKDAFYNVVSTESGVFVFAEKSIYRVDGDTTVPLLASYRNTTFPSSVNQFQLDDKLITFNASSIRLINTNDESILDLNMRPMIILDIKENGSLVWILCKKSLVAINKAKLSEGSIQIEKVIPLYRPPLKKGQLYKTSEKEIWIQSIDRLYRVDVDDPVIDYKPKIFLDKVNNIKGENLEMDGGMYKVNQADLPIEFVFKSTNKWTDNVNYAYYLNHNGRNISEWTKANIFEFNPKSNGKYILTAKLKDDIYGSNIFNDDISIMVKGIQASDSEDKPRYWIPIAVFALVLFLLWFVIRKI